MTRRVVAALVVLTLAILVAAVVPLALGAIAHERDSFVEDTARSAASVADIAVARLSDNAADPALSAALVSARQGARRTATARQVRPRRHLARESRTTAPGAVWWPRHSDQHDPTTQLTSDRAIAVQTVWGNGGTAIGTVVLERPTGPLNQNIANLWLYLVGLSSVAMAAAVLIAINFGRWVARPLAQLDTAARSIADGDLTVRAKSGTWPARAAPDGRHVQHDGRHGSRRSCTGTGRCSPTRRTSCAHRSPRCGCGSTCSPWTRRRPRPRSWPARRRRSPGCPGWSTG